MKRARKSKGVCPICGDPSKYKVGFCPACYSWHYITSGMTPRDAAGYAERFKIRLHRANSRLPVVRSFGRPRVA